LRLKQPRRLMMPLSTAEVARFWQSFRTSRDLAMVGLMLLDGLRSCEVLALELEDLQLSEARLRVLGKGQKPRVLPLAPEVRDVLQHYLRHERPSGGSPALFLCLKGRRRGQPLTRAGLRSLFRHHRRRSQSPRANPHRFRHTFGADMVRAGISLPALQKLMGHSHIQTTLRYIELAPEDVRREFNQALKKRTATAEAGDKTP
jgi:integrase/recombinase XerD